MRKVVLDEYERYGSRARWNVFAVSRLNRQRELEECSLGNFPNVTIHGKRFKSNSKPRHTKRSVQTKNIPKRGGRGQKPSDDPDFVKIEPGDKLGDYTIGNFIAVKDLCEMIPIK